MPPPSESDIIEEQIHFSNVVATFEQYASFSLSANNRRRKDFLSLPREDQAILEEVGFKQRLVDVDKAIIANAIFLKQMVAQPDMFGHDGEDEDDVGDDEGCGSAAQGDQGSSGPSGRGPPQPRPQSHSHSHDGPGGHHHTHSSPHSHSHDGPSRLSGPSNSNNGRGSRPKYRPTEGDMDKLRSTLKQFVRDWSEEGREERELCYGPMKDALLKYFGHKPEAERGKLRVLVPGVGLGRLAYDVAHLGFSCQGNEFSHYMLLASFYILNRTEQVNQHTIYPYVHSFSNIPNRDALLRSVTIPDALPSDIPKTANFSLVAGDFEEVYGADEHDEDEPQAGKWDAILTCFFIDTAKNVLNYLRVIKKILAPGGVWINLGPLLWHWENNTTNDVSIELDLEEFKTLCAKMGFKLENERTIDTSYTNNTRSMLAYTYQAAFWTATLSSENQNQ